MASPDPASRDWFDQAMCDPEFAREFMDYHVVGAIVGRIGATNPSGDAPATLRDAMAQAMADPAFAQQLRATARGLWEAWNWLEQDAKRDLGALGYQATPSSIKAYRDSLIRSESLIWASMREAPDVLKADIDRADAEKARDLPRVGTGSDSKSTVVELTDQEYENWVYGLVNLSLIKVAHGRALEAREHYLRLRDVTEFPSRAVFQEELAMRIRDHAGDSLDKETREVYAGESAAEASDVARAKYEGLLKEADAALHPRGSYFNSTKPKQLTIRKEITHGLRLHLGSHGSQLARSRAIAAALALFAGDLVFISADGPRQAAINIVQREHNRLPEGLAREVAERLEAAKMRREWLKKLD
jgi:hypothetical protein